MAELTDDALADEITRLLSVYPVIGWRVRPQAVGSATPPDPFNDYDHYLVPVTPADPLNELPGHPARDVLPLAVDRAQRSATAIKRLRCIYIHDQQGAGAALVRLPQPGDDDGRLATTEVYDYQNTPARRAIEAATETFTTFLGTIPSRTATTSGNSICVVDSLALRPLPA